MNTRSEVYTVEGGKKRLSLASLAHDVIKTEAAKDRSCTKCRESSCNQCTTKIAESLQKCFNRFGQQVGKRPWMTIILSLLLSAICAAGMVFWKVNTDDEELWTPYGSPFHKQREWILENFAKDTRYETAIISAQVPNDNILTAQSIQYLFQLHLAVSSISSPSNDSYEDLCLRPPNLADDSNSTRECATKSLLRIWNFNESTIYQLNDTAVLNAVSDRLSRHNDLEPLDQVENILSGVEYDEHTGKVARASAIMNIWLMKQNGTKESGGALVDEVARAWESAFLKQIIIEQVVKPPNGTSLDALAERSVEDGLDDTVNSNMQVMFGGFILIFVYIAFTLGRWNSLEQRVFLSFMGILVVGLSLGASFGFCFYWGIFFADMHPVIPFLLLGIGVDDMYVIVQALDNLSKEDKARPVHHRIGKAMEHAGVSITVTSVTDMAAFLIGSSTSMPILRAFCLFAAMGVLFLYIFAITFFVGCLTLDERRIDARKVINCNCIAPKPEDWKPIACSTKELGKNFFENMYGPFLAKPAVQVLVILLTLALAALGAYGVYHIELNYDSIKYLDQKSYQAKYFNTMTNTFPESGERVEVYVGGLPYWLYTDEMIQIGSVLANNDYIKEDSVEFWFSKFHDECCGPKTKSFCIDYFDWSAELSCNDELGFKRKLLLFLKEHPFYGHDMRFNITLEDLSEEEAMDVYIDGNFEITASRARFQHSHLNSTAMKTLAMNELRRSLSDIRFNQSNATSVNFLESPLPYSVIYFQWEANDIISEELIRNLSITFGTIAVVSILLIVNIQISIMVFVCVVLSVMNVCGFAYYLGLTIEIATSITLILCVGLALDYSAHVGVIFACLTTGSRVEKMRLTLGEIGTAVLNGGVSTFLAFAMLGASDSFVFVTFFEMFAMIVLFGLFHGLVFLPVILSLIGPNSPTDKMCDHAGRDQTKGHVNEVAIEETEKV